MGARVTNTLGLITALLLLFGAPVASFAGAAMKMPGQFQVSALGDADYSIPIAVPPGTGAAVPSLALSYSSASGSGTVGVGWTLSGLSAIGRCARTKAQDDVKGAVNYDTNDRFCLNGQRLMVINAGTYGADGSEYRTEIESFTKVIAHGTAGTGPAWFEVHTKSGQTLEFGNTTDSRILVPGGTTARVWTVNKVTDTAGNYYTATYTNDATNGQFYPTRIDYSGNAAAALTPYNSVQFTYETRPDIVPMYHAGAISKTTVRLTHVKAYVGTSAVNDYQLSYGTSPASGRSRVTSIKMCDGAGGNCIPATSFAYTGAALGFGNTQTNTIATSALSSGTAIYTGDWNGDGITDVMWYEYSTGNNRWFVSQYANGALSFTQVTNPITPATLANGVANFPSTYGLFFGDWNGDGVTDVMWRDANGNNRWFVNNGALSFTQYTNPIPPANLTYQSTLSYVYFGDWNGDGLTDMLWRGGPSNSLNHWLVNNGNMSFTETDNAITNSFASAVYVGDFNGDGFSDVMQMGDAGDGSQRWFLNDGALHFTSVDNPIPVASLSGAATPIFGDFNADGLLDVLWYKSSDGTNRWFLNKGNLTFTETDNPIAPSILTGTAGPMLGDWNADGITDAMWYSPSGGTNRWFTNNGTLSFSEQDNLLATGSINGLTLLTGDWNGDGSSDVMAYSLSSGANNWFFGTRAGTDLLSSITTGIGMTSTVTFSPLTDNSIYTRDASAAYPLVDLQGPAFVVTRIDQGNGIGGNLSATYSYGSLKGRTDGRGLLSFYQMKAFDLQTNILQTTTYRQDYPYIGLIAQVVRSHAAQTLSNTANTYGTVALGGTRNFPYLSQSVLQSSDLDGTALPTVTSAYQYDGYGNPTQVVVSTPDGASKTITNTYSNDTTHWFLGRLTNRQITSNWPHAASGAQNQKPNAVNDAKSTHAGTALTFDPRTNDTDPDGDALSITGKTNGAHGTVSIAANGAQLTYAPAAGYVGTDSFTYTISDGLGGFASATVSMTMSNTAPVAVNDTLLASINIAKTIDPRANDSDADGDALTISAKTDGAHGTVAIGTGGTSLTYTPATGYTGADSFTYTVADGNGGTATASVAVTVSPNQPPVAVNDSASTSKNVAVTFDPRTNDSDPDSDPLTITAKTDGAHGTVAIGTGGVSLTYTPATNYVGADSFTYTISDGKGASATASVAMTVNGPPVANNDTKTLNQESGANTITVLANDTDPQNYALTVTAVTQGTKGTVAITTGGGSVTYTPANRSWGTDSFTYTVTNTLGLTATATVSVSINQIDETVMQGQGNYVSPYIGGSGTTNIVYCIPGCFNVQVPYYFVKDTRTNTMVYSVVGAATPPACNSTANWASGFWVSSCNVYKDVTP